MVTTLLLGAVAGCGGAETTTGSGGGGAGGDGTAGSATSNTTSGGPGGNGGSDGGAETGGNGGDGTGDGGGDTGNGGSAAGNGGGGAGNGGSGSGGSGVLIPGGDVEPVCQKHCLAGTCVGGTCIMGAYASMGLAQSEAVFPNGTEHLTSISRCDKEINAPVWSIEMVGSFGPCVVFKLTDIDDSLTPLAGGTVTVQSPTLGALEIPEPVHPSGCDGEYLQPAPVVPAGEIVGFSSTGGADVPAFSFDIAVPLPITLSLPRSLQLGDPLVIAWDPPPPPDRLGVILADGHQLWCEPVDPSQLVVPGEVIAMFAGSNSLALVIASRFSMMEEVVDSGGAPLYLTASVSSGQSLAVDLLP
jgi:hypothetical protein